MKYTIFYANIGKRLQMNFKPKMAVLKASEFIGLAALAFGGGSAAFAKDETPMDGKSSTDDDGFDLEISASGTFAERSREGFDDSDSSNARLRAEAGYEGGNEMTKFRLEMHVGASDYRKDGDGARLNWGARGRVTHELSQSIAAEFSAGHSANNVVLESTKADQTRIAAKLSLKQGSKTIEASAAYRWRDYDDALGGKGKGWEAGARVHKRFGSYHWVAASVSHDRIDSGVQRRGYNRTSFTADYSVPIAKNLRFVAGAERRNWTYQGRFIGDVISAPKRQDTLTRPEIGLSYGRRKGAYIRGSAGYDFYKSNDTRFSGNGPRAQITMGFRF
jgi:hypothetical protein